MMLDLLVIGQQRKSGKERRLGRAQTHKERWKDCAVEIPEAAWKLCFAVWLTFSPRSLGCPGVPSYLLGDIGQDPFIPIGLPSKGVGAG